MDVIGVTIRVTYRSCSQMKALVTKHCNPLELFMVLDVYKIYEVTAVKVDNTLLSKQTSGFEHSDLKSQLPIFGSNHYFTMLWAAS